MQEFQVAIIGAGLGGLCLAQGLKKHGIAFAVFERDAALDSRSQGYRIRINGDGQAALRRCLPPELYALFEASCAAELNAPRALDVQLNSVARWNDAWRSEEPGAVDLKAHRHTLREVLMCGIAEHVHFDKELRGVVRHGGGSVSFDFADGSAYRADLLVGADGSNSRVAAQCFPAMRGLDADVVCIYGKADGASLAIADELRGGTSVVFDTRLAMVIDAMRFSPAGDGALSPVEDYLYWAMIGSRERLGIAAGTMSREADARRCIADVSGGWAPGLRAVFAATPPGMLTMLPVRQSPPPQPWPPGRVTVLGDAVHTMSPASGLGCNTAFLDAASLAAQLATAAGGAVTPDQAVAAYEREMRERAVAALQASARGGAQLYGGDI
ncbi:NAD(P)-binding protein [Rugamonas sp. FT82W]|uniref:NAD(P)-binding protein n=1 Tax=Duganella vulcania TaxID=2692166 RepID=A0A845G3W0_9BURK|nr:NAD(P)/FAD-dependent oxidoreductase [Duganella vulcania]MYM88132.1 NAD(P)-binding protein [Duganella vulcania]